jgi:cytosine/adenosine deaminase-related metal-dependent hydrolase
MLGEARQAMLLQRVGWPGFESSAGRFSAREALELATLGGAEVLNRKDIGSLEVGKAADFVAFRIDDLHHAGGQSDKVASLLSCAPTGVWLSVINGSIIVQNGELLNVDIENLIIKHNQLAHKMLVKAGVA